MKVNAALHNFYVLTIFLYKVRTKLQNAQNQIK